VLEVACLAFILEYQVEQLRDWVASAKAYGTNEVLFAISPKFIKETTILDYPGTIIILSGCFGLYSEALPQAFLDRGTLHILHLLGYRKGMAALNYMVDLRSQGVCFHLESFA
jgi:hypothetical protein